MLTGRRHFRIQLNLESEVARIPFKSLSLASIAALVSAGAVVGLVAPTEAAMVANLAAIGAIWFVGLILGLRVSAAAGLSLWAVGGAVGAATVTSVIWTGAGVMPFVSMILLTLVAFAYASRSVYKIIDAHFRNGKNGVQYQ